MTRTRKKRSQRDLLRDKAWRIFSAWIRKRDPYCVTCLMDGKRVQSQQAGHFYHNVLDFDEDNVNGQCIKCNHFLSGNLAPYSNYLLKKLGKRKFDELNTKHYQAMKSDKKDEQYYLDIIEKYKL